MAWIEQADGWWLTGTALSVRVDPSTGAIDRSTVRARSACCGSTPRYWFGARERWGDVMPHHWAAVTAWAWALRGAADNDQHWRDRAAQLSLATLHTFTADGRASAAFVYPAMVNGSNEHRFGPPANDQDWALVTAQDIPDLALLAPPGCDGRPVPGPNDPA
jgi:hypothetical protein